jgi:hypothetical protein
MRKSIVVAHLAFRQRTFEETINEEELRVAVFAQPFEPKRLRLTNGENYEIPHPGAIAIGRRVCGVVVNGMIHQIANVHIAQLGPLEVAAH